MFESQPHCLCRLRKISSNCLAAMVGVIAAARSPSSAIAIIDETKADGPFTETILGAAFVGVAVGAVRVLTAGIAREYDPEGLRRCGAQVDSAPSGRGLARGGDAACLGVDWISLELDRSCVEFRARDAAVERRALGGRCR